jgi:hypothetical protein
MRLRNNFSSGPSGTTITVGTSGAGDDDPWYLVSKTGANTVMAYDLAPERPTAEFVGLFSTGAAVGQAVVAWVPGGNFATLYARAYCWLDTAPNNFASPAIFYTENSVGAAPAVVGINSAGSNELFAEDHNGVNNIIMSTGIPVQQWFRWEVKFTYAISGTGTCELRYYQDPDSDTPTETVSATNWTNTSANAANFYWAYITAAASLEPLRLSGLEINDTGWPGPLPFRQKAVPGIQPSAIAIHSDTF